MRNYILSISILFTISCETIVELDMPIHQPVMVLNSTLEDDSVCNVFLSHSRGAFDQNEINAIKNANVILSYQDLSFSLEQDSTVDYSEATYYYTHSNKLISGLEYVIEVNHPDYNSVFANTRIPQNINFLNYEINSLDSTALRSSRLKLNFLDHLNEDNYYRIRLFASYDEYEDWDYWDYDWLEYDLKQFVKYTELELYSNDPSLSDGSIPWEGYSFTGSAAFFTDDLFDGEQKELVFDLDLDLNNFAAGDSLFLELTSFSEEAYNYMYSVIRSQNSFVSPFGTEPVSVYSNIENGIGIFMGANILDTLLVP